MLSVEPTAPHRPKRVNRATGTVHPDRVMRALHHVGTIGPVSPMLITTTSRGDTG
jgi:hypothetical protein